MERVAWRGVVDVAAGVVVGAAAIVATLVTTWAVVELAAVCNGDGQGLRSCRITLEIRSNEEVGSQPQPLPADNP